MSELSELQTFQQMMMSFDSPAYMRRARDTQAAWNAVQSVCRRQRAEWLELPALRLNQWLQSIDRDPAMVGEFSSDDRATLMRLSEEWKTDRGLSASAGGRPTDCRKKPSPPTVRNATGIKIAADLRTSFQRFNTRWAAFLASVDLSTVNRLRRDYNEFYVLEKECAVRSAEVARSGFEPLPSATTDDLLTLFPLLPIEA